jgi:hypothetical protein
MKRMSTYTTFGPPYPSRINVERALPEHVPDVGPEVHRVLSIAYISMLEERMNVIPEGIVEQEVFKVPSEQTERMHNAMTKNAFAKSSYWIARADMPEYNWGVCGVIKTTPSRPSKLKPWVENCFLNDIAAAVEGHGLGSVLMYTALSDYDDDRKVLLNAFVGNDVANQWFEDLGFETQDIKVDPFMIGEIALPQVRYEAVAVGGVKEALQAARPWLRG